MGNRVGIIDTPNLGLKRGTSRGFMDNKTQGKNWDILDSIAGAVPTVRYLLGATSGPPVPFNPMADIPLADTWTYVPLENPELRAILPLPAPLPIEFDGSIRFSNKVKLVCCRIRAIDRVGGAGGILSIQFRKGEAGATADDDLLINPVEFTDGAPVPLNLSGVGRGTPTTPVIGGDADPISLWMMRDGVFSSTDVDFEILLMAQMLSDLPPVEIVEGP